MKENQNPAPTAAEQSAQRLGAGADPRNVAAMELHALLDELGNVERRLLGLVQLQERKAKLDARIEHLRQVIGGLAQFQPEPATV